MRHPNFRILLVLPLFFSGCELMQYVAPHQLWKLNRQPAMEGEDGYFSIPAESASETKKNSNTSGAGMKPDVADQGRT
jgi:hypothetical protein